MHTVGKLNVKAIAGAKFLGELCNNPLNIMDNGDKWQGMIGHFRNKAGGYCVFDEKDNIAGWIWGYRAAFVDWNSKKRRWKSLTLRKLINAWAPASAHGHNNDPDAYMRSVAINAKVDLDTELDLTNREQAINIAKAMTIVECTRCIYSSEDIGRAWDLANGIVKPKPMSESITTKAVVTAGVGGVLGKIADHPQVQDIINNTLPQIAQSANLTGWFGWAFFALVVIGAATALWRLRKDRTHDV